MGGWISRLRNLPRIRNAPGDAVSPRTKGAAWKR